MPVWPSSQKIRATVAARRRPTRENRAASPLIPAGQRLPGRLPRLARPPVTATGVPG